MMEHKMQNGYIYSLDKAYIFTYDGELLQLVPKEQDDIRRYDFLRNTNKYLEILEGITQNLQKIFFLNCHLQVSGSGYISKPAGFVCCDSDITTFDVMTFKGGIMNSFYRANQIVDEVNSTCNYDTGESIIRLKPFSETSKYNSVQIMGKNIKMVLSITQPGVPVYLDVDYNLGKPETILRLTFTQSVSMSEFREIYMWIYNLLVFLNFRKDISMGKIELGRLDENRKVEKVAYTYIIDKDKAEISNINNIIGYYFVNEQLNELLQIINKPELNLLFIPKSYKAGKSISPEKYMVCCTSFESVFNFVFPNAKMEYSKVANEVKEEFLDYISGKEEEYKGKEAKKRKEFKKYANMIKVLDFSLAEKFEYCQLQYKEIIKSYEWKVWERFDLPVDMKEDMARSFADKRNMLMHNSLEAFEDIHVIAYLVARAFIYIMIMKKVGIKDDFIIQGIDNVL